MALYTLPKQYHPDFSQLNKKPIGPVEIDWANPLTKGLVICYAPTHSSTRANIVKQKDAVLNGTQFPLLEVRDNTVSTNFGSTSLDSSIEFEGIDSSPQGLTILTKTRPIGSGDYFGANAQNFGSNNITGGSGLLYRQITATGGSPNPGKQRFTILGVADYDSANFALDGSAFQSHGVRVESGGSLDFMINGLVDYNVASVGSFTAGNGSWCIGAFAGGAIMYSSVEFEFVWSRKLTEAEYNSVNRNPYQIIKPQTPAAYSTVEASSGISITVAEQGPSFTETINATLTSLTIESAITESGPSFTESINVDVLAGLVEVAITESGPSFTESINVDLSKNIAAAITESGPSFTESININITKDITAELAVQGPSFTDSIIASIPVIITVNPKNILNVKRTNNNVIIKKRSTAIKISRRTNTLKVK